MVSELDVIQLRVAVGAWAAGTVATVLEVRSDSVLAEVADGEGRTLETIVVPTDALRPAAPADIDGHPAMSTDVRVSGARESAA